MCTFALALFAVLLAMIPFVRLYFPSYNIANCFVCALSNSVINNKNFDAHANATLLFLMVNILCEINLLMGCSYA